MGLMAATETIPIYSVEATEKIPSMIQTATILLNLKRGFL